MAFSSVQHASNGYSQPEVGLPLSSLDHSTERFSLAQAEASLALEGVHVNGECGCNDQQLQVLTEFIA